MKQLRPMGTGELLDAGLGIYRQRFPLLVRVATIGYGLPSVLYVYVVANGGPVAQFVLGFATLLLWSLGGLVVSAAAMQIIADAYLGRGSTVAGALITARSRLWPLFLAGTARWGVVLFAPFVLFIPVTVGTAIVTAGGGGAVGALAVAAMALAAVVVSSIIAVVLSCGYSVVAQIAVLEKLANPLSALGRSWALTKGMRSRALLLGLVAWLLTGPPGLAIGVFTVIWPSLELSLTVLSAVLSILIAPIIACVFTLFYYDLRVRKEAFDLEVLNEQITAVSGAAA